MPGYKVAVELPSQTELQVGIFADSLTQLTQQVQRKFNIPGPLSVYLQDGTLVCDEEYFSILEPQTKFRVKPGVPGGSTCGQKRPMIHNPSRAPPPYKRTQSSPVSTLPLSHPSHPQHFQSPLIAPSTVFENIHNPTHHFQNFMQGPPLLPPVPNRFVHAQLRHLARPPVIEPNMSVIQPFSQPFSRQLLNQSCVIPPPQPHTVRVVTVTQRPPPPPLLRLDGEIVKHSPGNEIVNHQQPVCIQVPPSHKNSETTTHPDTTSTRARQAVVKPVTTNSNNNKKVRNDLQLIMQFLQDKTTLPPALDKPSVDEGYHSLCTSVASSPTEAPSQLESTSSVTTSESSELTDNQFRSKPNKSVETLHGNHLLSPECVCDSSSNGVSLNMSKGTTKCLSRVEITSVKETQGVQVNEERIKTVNCAAVEQANTLVSCSPQQDSTVSNDTVFTSTIISTQNVAVTKETVDSFSSTKGSSIVNTPKVIEDELVPDNLNVTFPVFIKDGQIHVKPKSLRHPKSIIVNSDSHEENSLIVETNHKVAHQDQQLETLQPQVPVFECASEQVALTTLPNYTAEQVHQVVNCLYSMVVGKLGNNSIQSQTEIQDLLETATNSTCTSVIECVDILASSEEQDSECIDMNMEDVQTLLLGTDKDSIVPMIEENAGFPDVGSEVIIGTQTVDESDDLATLLLSNSDEKNPSGLRESMVSDETEPLAPLSKTIESLLVHADLSEIDRLSITEFLKGAPTDPRQKLKTFPISKLNNGLTLSLQLNFISGVWQGCISQS